MTTDFSVLTDLVQKWKEVITAIDGLPGRIHKELMKPLRDEGRHRHPRKDDMDGAHPPAPLRSSG
ncbi:hypothetical protein [Streptomyces sp. WMMB303]|uniref:hypothetical protein n=1 Tax=Streptomyces sp. WMMB303 TaxID=3034154 RepID=UPI0023ED342B|nr:hypothetical protein [Streptomyces sp. WMMB303]MDF4250033.1 hypothetical protein [Streptomyces sp. WMMB303]